MPTGVPFIRMSAARSGRSSKDAHEQSRRDASALARSIERPTIVVLAPAFRAANAMLDEVPPVPRTIALFPRGFVLVLRSFRRAR
jgi:hypothetical protein